MKGSHNGDTITITSKFTLKRDGKIICETEEITVTPLLKEGYNWTEDQLSKPPK